MLFIAVLLLALMLHLFLGWQWTLLAGVVYGFYARRLGALLSSLACGLSWAQLVLWNLAVAPFETGNLTEAVGGLLGNIPSWAVVAVTILIGMLCGLLGALIGRRIRLLFRPPSRGTPSPGMPDLSFLQTPSPRD